MLTQLCLMHEIIKLKLNISVHEGTVLYSPQHTVHHDTERALINNAFGHV